MIKYSGLSTPSYILDFNKVTKNIKTLNDQINILNNYRIYYSVKSNNVPILLEFLSSKNISFECVSEEEFDYLRSLNYDMSDVIVNGPSKTDSLIKKAIENNSYINIDSLNDMKLLINNNNLIQKYKFNKIGVRLNLCFSNRFMFKLIGYNESRFGLSYQDFQYVIEVFEEKNLNISGLHFHINQNYSISRAYKFIANYIAKIMHENTLDLKYINLGGGILRATESINFKDILSSFSKELIKNNINTREICFMFEPGAALVANAGIIVSKVVSKKRINNKWFLTIDASKNYYDITNKFSKWNHYHIVSNSKSIIREKQIICGFSCMETDRLFTLKNQIELDIGDFIVIDKVGTYSINFIPFFIKGYPSIYYIAEGKNNIKLAYKNMSIKEFWNNEQVNK